MVIYLGITTTSRGGQKLTHLPRPASPCPTSKSVVLKVYYVDKGWILSNSCRVRQIASWGFKKPQEPALQKEKKNKKIIIIIIITIRITIIM
jgi:hypothetical protein